MDLFQLLYLILSTELLKQVNAACEGGEYFYSPFQYVQSSDTRVNEFKVQLIRLIANLCYKHVGNQNKVTYKILSYTARWIVASVARFGLFLVDL